MAGESRADGLFSHGSAILTTTVSGCMHPWSESSRTGFDKKHSLWLNPAPRSVWMAGHRRMVLTFFFFFNGWGKKKKIKKIPFPLMGNLHDIQASVSVNTFSWNTAPCVRSRGCSLSGTIGELVTESRWLGSLTYLLSEPLQKACWKGTPAPTVTRGLVEAMGMFTESRSGMVQTMAAFYGRACDCSELLEENGSGKVALRLTLRALTLSQSMLVQVQTSTRCSLGFRFSAPEVKGAGHSPSHAQVRGDSRFAFPLRGVFWPGGDTVTETLHHLQLGRSAEGARGGAEGPSPFRDWWRLDFGEQVEPKPLHLEHPVTP